MKAIIFAFEAPEGFARRKDKARYKAYLDEWYAFGDVLQKAGVFKGGGALQSPETATVIKVANGKRGIEDGPFTDSKEQLGGYFLIEVDTLDQAAALSRKCPAAKDGRVEVRAIPDYGQGE